MRQTVEAIIGPAVADIDELELHIGNPSDIDQAAERVSVAGTVAAGTISATGEFITDQTLDYAGLRVSWSNGDNHEQEAEVTITHSDPSGTTRTTVASVKPGTFVFVPWSTGPGGKRFVDALRLSGDGVASVLTYSVAIAGVQSDASLTVATVHPYRS